jgi:hypothetical protein
VAGVVGLANVAVLDDVVAGVAALEVVEEDEAGEAGLAGLVVVAC